MFSRAGATELAGELEDVLRKAAPAIVAGGAATALVGALPGLAVGVVFAGVSLTRRWKEDQRPYRFLSHLAAKGAEARHVLEASPA